MTKVKDLKFDQRKKLPKHNELMNEYGIKFDSSSKQFDSRGFESKLNGNFGFLEGGTYLLEEFLSDYYRMELKTFRLKFQCNLKRQLTSKGYIKSINRPDMRLPIRDLAFFANKEKKFVRELAEGRSRGKWVKTIHYDGSITTSNTDIIRQFVDTVIEREQLRPHDIIMLKFLKHVSHESYAVYKIFKSVDVRHKQRLYTKVNGYSDGFFGRNEDYSEDIDRIELDMNEAIIGGCNKRQLKSNDSKRRITHPKSSNNNCFFKCIQPYISSIYKRISKKACNQIRCQFHISPNNKVDVQAALDIFRHFREESSFGLKIWSKDVLVGEVQGDSVVSLIVEDEHYSILQIKQYQYCKECGRQYISKHKCNTNRIVYKIMKEGKYRAVPSQYKQDEFNFDKSDSDVVVVHYDIETHTRSTVSSYKLHTPYIVGFVENLDHQFRYYTGEDCIEQFIRRVLTYPQNCNCNEFRE